MALALVSTTSAPALAYVRAVAEQSGLSSFWSSSCEILTINVNGYTGMSRDEIAKSIAAAAHAWSPDVVTCPAANDGGIATGHPTFEIIPQIDTSGSVPNVGPDGHNVLIFQTETWAYLDAIAVTSRNTDPSGRIFDADIEVNATADSGIIWANLDPCSAPAKGGQDRIDLQEAITHEFGHFVGLAHTCYHEGYDPPPRPLDDQGRLSRYCMDGIPEQSAVMWYMVDPNTTTKRVITTDDARGLCAIYAPESAVPLCTANLPNDGCGCTTAAGSPISPLCVVATLLLGIRRRPRG
jgi:hypothetical protein